MLTAEVLVKNKKVTKNNIKKINNKYMKCICCGLYGIYKKEKSTDNVEINLWEKVQGRIYDSICLSCKKKINNNITYISYNKDFIEDFIED